LAASLRIIAVAIVIDFVMVMMAMRVRGAQILADSGERFFRAVSISRLQRGLQRLKIFAGLRAGIEQWRSFAILRRGLQIALQARKGGLRLREITGI
jgi:hypothetical protein